MDRELYNREVEAIFNRFPSFQKVGGSAYKPGLETMRKLVTQMGNPQERFLSLHVAGTNGKGSTSHILAVALSALRKDEKNYKVGLYTSPHLLDFRERMKISCRDAAGRPTFYLPSREFVYDFLVKNRALFEQTEASFFEITTAMAFYWFAEQEVDIAVVECGLGGRLDATNIITPLVSVITNIGLDHCEYLGNTLEAVAAEKCGIIKRGVPVVVGDDSGVKKVFDKFAANAGSKIYYAEQMERFIKTDPNIMDLKGAYQIKNLKCAGAALQVLFGRLNIEPQKIAECYENIYHTAEISLFLGRWTTVMKVPHVICDTGHNAHAFKILGREMSCTLKQNSPYTANKYRRGICFFGVVADKDLDAIMNLLPKEFYYYFVNAKGKRALPAEALCSRMKEHGFEGEILGSGGVQESLELFFNNKFYTDRDFIYVGGSSYVVAEALPFFAQKEEQQREHLTLLAQKLKDKGC